MTKILAPDVGNVFNEGRDYTYNFAQGWGNAHLPFGQIPSYFPSLLAWGKTLIGA